MAEQKVMQNISLVDMFYPVGSYYETSDADFDPNIKWGGRWVLETAGQVHVSAGEGYPIAGALLDQSDGGEVTHKLTVDEMPSHTHIQDRHRHIRGGNWHSSSGASTGNAIKATASQKYTADVYTGYATPTNQNTGGDKEHNNMQPYIVVNRWHRVI